MKILLTLMLVLLSSCMSNPSHFSLGFNHSAAKATVKIMNRSQTGAGTGVVIYSSPAFSKILTNAHVCRMLDTGGTVASREQTSYVLSYTISELHDLCLITVSDDFKISTTIAEASPSFLDEATISGHPHAFPLVVTKGHFSDSQYIQILEGYRDCTDAERANPDTGLFCALMGHLPVVAIKKARLVSATIMAGSSGSGVYNADGELAGLVFAGSEGLSYAFIVPLEYIQTFLTIELTRLTAKFPNSSDSQTAQSKFYKPTKERVVNTCNLAVTENQLETCALILSDIWL